MEITEEDVRQFRNICVKNYGVDLSPHKAGEIISRLNLLYGHMDEWARKRGSVQPPHALSSSPCPRASADSLKLLDISLDAPSTVLIKYGEITIMPISR